MELKKKEKKEIFGWYLEFIARALIATAPIAILPT